MRTTAMVLQEPTKIAVSELDLTPAAADDLIVAIDHSAISTGTERLLYTGAMPAFPGMGYPLVPGYEAIGRIIRTDAAGTMAPGQRVFVPGANCFVGARGLFGASASHVVVPAARIVPIGDGLGDEAVLLALAATAQHTFSGFQPPDLIVGHGTLGRLLARLVVASGAPTPTVWEIDATRAEGAQGYGVVHPDADPRRDYRAITDVSGDPAVLDSLIGRLAPGGEVCLAGFYAKPISFVFPPAFMREARLRIAAQWKPADLAAVSRLNETGALSLDGLITHRAEARDASQAYATAFGDASCLKMVLDWSRV